MSKITYLKPTKTVRIDRDGDRPMTIFISARGPLFLWHNNRGKRGVGEGFYGLHKMCDDIGNLSLEEYEFLISKI